MKAPSILYCRTHICARITEVYTRGHNAHQVVNSGTSICLHGTQDIFASYQHQSVLKVSMSIFPALCQFNVVRHKCWSRWEICIQTYRSNSTQGTGWGFSVSQQTSISASHALKYHGFDIDYESHYSWSFSSPLVYWICLLGRCCTARLSKHADVRICVQTCVHLPALCMENIKIKILNTCRVDVDLYYCSSKANGSSY